MEKIEFDKARCMNNIYDIADSKKIKIKDLEKSAGLSTGYISKLAQPDNTTIPNGGILLSIAQDLEVSVDYLLKGGYKMLNRSEKRIVDFIIKLINDTKEQEITWLVEAPFEINSITDESGKEIFSTEKDPFGGFHSLIDDCDDYYLSGPSYKTSISTTSQVYIIPLLKTVEEQRDIMPAEFYEMYIIDYDYTDNPFDEYPYSIITIPLFSTRDICDDIKGVTAQLIEEIKESRGQLHLGETATNIISKYLGSAEDIPF